MNGRLVCAVVVLSLSVCRGTAVGSSNSEWSETGKRPIVLKLSDLRSAYLLRAGVVHYDVAVNSPDGVRQQLQRHFDVVLGLLQVATPHSIETALNRLQDERGKTWSASERDRWRQQLLRNRYRQLLRLAAYRDRGMFPLNEGQAAAPAPIFVDRYDTACAVGHLMRLSAWHEVVADVQRNGNLVYVPDAPGSAIARWTRWSGLTLEEAALIQPGYPFIVPQTLAEYGPNGPAFVRDGLRYENFHLHGENYINPPTDVSPDLCVFIPHACLGTPDGFEGIPIASQIGFRVGTGTYAEPQSFAYLDPVGTHWIGIGGVSPFFAPLGIGGQALPGRAQRLFLYFDVSTVDPEMRINQLTQHNDELEGGFSSFRIFPPIPADAEPNYVMLSRAYADQTTLGTTVLDRRTPYVLELQSGGEQRSTMNFSPQSRIAVETQLLMIDGVVIDTYALDFNVVRVPEPGCGLLFIAGAVVACVLQRGKRRSL